MQTTFQIALSKMAVAAGLSYLHFDCSSADQPNTLEGIIGKEAADEMARDDEINLVVDAQKHGADVAEDKFWEIAALLDAAKTATGFALLCDGRSLTWSVK